MVPAETCEVLVVGAGPTGLTAAVDLARRGVDVRIVEAAPGPRRESRGRGLQPRTLEVLDDLGIAGRLYERGVTRDTVRLYAGATRVGELAWAEPDRPRPGVVHRGTLVIPQWRVEEALRERLSELGGRVEFGSWFGSFEQPDGTSVRATVTGPGRAEHVVTAAFLLGADGGHSRVRAGLGVAFEGRTSDDAWVYAGDVNVAGLGPGDRVTHLWYGPGSRLTILSPNPGEETWWLLATADPERIADGTRYVPKPTPELCTRLLAERSGRSDLELTGATWLSRFRLNIRLADRFLVGRVGLAGDAAHVHTPAGGLGMNTGIQDAYNLAWKVAAVVRGADEGLLDSYHQEREPVARKVLRDSTRQAELLAGRGTAVRLLRRYALLPAARVPPVGRLVGRRLLARNRRLTLNYRHSDLSCELGGSGLRGHGGAGRRIEPGDRVPNARLYDAATNGDVELFELTRGPHWTLLGFGPSAQDTVQAVCARYPSEVRGYVVGGPISPMRLRDRYDEARMLMRPTPGTVLAVRPDGHVGLRQDGPRTGAEGLAAYLEPLVGSAADQERPAAGPRSSGGTSGATDPRSV